MATKKFNDNWHEPIDEEEYKKWLARMDEKTREMYLRPPPKLAEWQKTYCGCYKCIHTDYYLKNSVPSDGRCLKEVARDNEILEKSKRRFFPTTTWDGFRPAKPEQITEWNTWLFSPEAETVYKRLESIEEEAKKKWASHKFDPFKMEETLERNAWLDNMSQENYIKTSPYWIAFMAFGREQYSLYMKYNNVITKSIKTKEEYNLADKLYKELTQHIDKHGHIIVDTPEKRHKLPKENLTDTPKMGRRAARKLRNTSDSSSSTVSRQEVRSSKVATVQSYMMLGRDY